MHIFITIFFDFARYFHYFHYYFLSSFISPFSLLLALLPLAIRHAGLRQLPFRYAIRQLSYFASAIASHYWLSDGYAIIFIFAIFVIFDFHIFIAWLPIAITPPHYISFH
jgi:hypothetical protein